MTKTEQNHDLRFNGLGGKNDRPKILQALYFEIGGHPDKFPDDSEDCGLIELIKLPKYISWMKVRKENNSI